MEFTDIKIIHFLFRIGLFIACYFNGYFISKSKTKISLLSFSPSIIAYSLYAGLRWGRGVDYNHYYFVYNGIIDGNYLDEIEPVFKILVILFGRVLNMPWSGFVFLMSFFLACASCLFLKNYRKYLCFSLPFFLLSTSFSENFMRWSLAFSFVLIGLSFLIVDKKSVKGYLLLLMGFGTHYGFIINILVFVFFLFYSKKLRPIIVVPLLVLFTFVVNGSVFLYFEDILQTINIGTRFSGYQKDAAIWLDSDNQQVETLKVGLSNFISSILIVVGGYLVSLRRDICYIYNLACVGIMTFPLFQSLELTVRINIVIYIFKYVVFGIIVYEVMCYPKLYKQYIRIPVYLYFLFYLYGSSVSVTFNEKDEQHLYLWDSNGRNYQ